MDETTLNTMRMRTALRFAAGTALLGAGTFAYASLIERNMFTLRRYDVPVLGPDAEPLRVLHLSDLHMTPGQTRKRDWVASLAATDPDLVISTGDHLAHPEAVTSVAAALRPLLDRPGAFVFGSNDYYGPIFKNPFGYFSRHRDPHRHGVELPAEELRETLVSGGWADLNNARTLLKAGGMEIELAGVDDPHVGRDSYPARERPTEAPLTIGVTHSPEPVVLDEMAADGMRLLLAGHTHGGQVRLPGVGALVTNSALDRSRARGLSRWGARMWLNVSAGLGNSPYMPVRLFCRPEATLLTLVPRD